MAEGGCLCGSVRYRIAGEIGPASYCHCSDCRKVTGSAFNVGVAVAVDTFALNDGRLGSHTHPAESGTLLTRYFCAECGSPIYGGSPRHPDIIYVRAGTFDDPSVVRPDKESWTRSRVNWASIPSTIQSFKRGRTQ